MSRIGHESEPPRSTLRRLGREHGQVVAPSGSFFPLRVGCRHECAQRGLEQGRIGREGGNAMKSVQTGTLLPAIPSESSVEQELRAAIQRSESELTIADLVVATGMPRRCIEEALTRLTGEYRCGAAVTESGELLYRFAGRAETTTGTSPTAVRVLKGIGKAGGRILRGLAKRTPLAFMTGYFVLFLTFPFPPALILLAILLSSWSDMDLLDFYGIPRYRETVRMQSPLAMFREYLCGAAGLPEQRTKAELLSTLSTVRDEMGVISLRDILAVTGLSPENAQQYLDKFLVRFTGEPAVTAGGRVVYHFPELLKTGGAALPAAQCTGESCTAEVVESGSRRKHGVLALMNLSNLLFSVYYGVLSIRTIVSGQSVAAGSDQMHPGVALLFNAIYSLASESHAAFALPGLFFGLGVVPFGVASLFFVLHRRAMGRQADGQRRAAERRLRREVYAQVFATPERVDPGRIRVPFDIGRRRSTGKAVASIIDELAASYHAEIEDDGEGHFIYRFPELDAEGRELAEIRRGAKNAQRTVERVIFDSRENAR